MEDNDPIETLCDQNMWIKIFRNLNNQTEEFNKTKNLLCSVTGKEFILDIQRSLELDDFARIVRWYLKFKCYYSTYIKNQTLSTIDERNSVDFYQRCL